MRAPTGQGRPETTRIPVLWMQRSKDTISIAIWTLVLLAGAIAPAWAQAPRAERPSYTVGDRWIRSDGAYDLIRIENARYVFAADGGREVHLTRDLGVNLAGVEIILNMRRKIEQMQKEVNEFMEYVKRELTRGIDDWEQRLSTALVKSTPSELVRAQPPATASPDAPPQASDRASRKQS